MTIQVHPTALVDARAEIGQRVEIGPFCTIGPDVSLGDGVRLISHVSVAGHTSIGSGTTVFPFAALGHAPQDNKYRDEPTRLVIGNNNTIREHVSFHRGSVTGRTETRVGDNNLFMAGSHVAHDCLVGNKVTFANNATLGGMVEVQDRVTLGGLSAVHQLGRVGQGAFIGGGAPVTGDVIPYGMVDNHGRLHGLNIIGLQRNGADRSTINTLRSAYRFMFDGDGNFRERVAVAEQDFSDCLEVRTILEFIKADTRRPICMPRTGP